MGFLDFFKFNQSNAHLITNGYEPPYTLDSSIILGKKKALFVDHKNIGYWYNAIPELKIILDYKARMFANVRFTIVDKDDKQVENKEIENLLKNPNPLQSRNEFLATYKLQEQVYGNSFVLGKKVLSNSTPRSLWILPSNQMKINTTGLVYGQDSLEDIIENYDLEYAENTKETYEVRDILHKKSQNIKDIRKGKSQLEALKMPLSNIKAAYESRNVLINERGAIGILTSNAKDSDGGMPLDETEKKNIQKQYKKSYGLGKNKDHVIITESALHWQPMAFPVKDLMLFEEVEADLNRIIDAFGLNRNIFSQEKGTTFENVKESLKMVYQNTIIPEAEDFAESLTTFLNLENQRIKASYDHVPALQADEVRKAKVYKTKVDTLNSMFDKGIITLDQYKILLDDERL